MPRPLLTAAVVVAATLVPGPAAALAQDPPPPGPERFQGRTQQSRTVTLSTGADGLVRSFRMAWVGSCRRAFVYRTTTRRIPPFAQSTTERFRDGGAYRERSRGGIVATIAVNITGVHEAPEDRPRAERWRGTFRATVTVRRSGRVLDRCRTRSIRWTATLRRPASAE
jgi:hypothetical protein